MKKASRFLAVLLVLCMVLSMIPAVFAADQEGTTYVLASTLKAGDEVIIFNPAVNMALNKEIVSTYYKGGTQVTPVDGAITTSSTSIVWTVSADGDGFNLANDEGQKLSIDGTWNSIPYDKGNDAWPVSAATTEGCVYVVNENGKYMHWNKNYKNFGATDLSKTSEEECALQLYVKDDGSEEPATPSAYTYILHSNDVHGAVEGYAYMAALKAHYEDEGAEVILADAGDYSQGTTYVSVSKGATAIEMMNLTGYDVVGLGNHEFDYGFPQLKENMEKADFTVLCSDVLDENGKSIFDAYTIIEKSGVKIGFFGLETPETQTKANPALIKGLTFLTDSTETTIWQNAQQQVDAMKAEGADIIVCLSHLGVDASSEPYRSYDLYSKVTGIDFIIDAHSHTVMTDGEKGEPIQSTGTKFANIGVIKVNNETKKIEDHWLCEIGEEYWTVKDETVAAAAQKIIDEIETKYGQVFATSEVTLNGEKDPGNRTEETNNGDLITDAMVWCLTEQYPNSITLVPEENIVAITNGGGIRAAVKPGDVTMNDILTVLPFGNTVAVVYVTGAELLEALEASTYCTPVSVGGFPQVSGIKFTIDTTKEYDANAETYPGSTYYGPASINRVTIDEVNGKAFDPTATYAVLTNNFCAGGGDTYYAFASASSQFDTTYTLDAVVIDYITEKLGGKITAEQYGEPQGRITVIKSEDKWDGKITIGGLDAGLWTTKYGNIYTDASAKNVFEDLGFNYGDLITVKFLDQELVLPLVSNFSDVDSGTAALFVAKSEAGEPSGYAYLAINMGNFTDTYGIATKKTDESGNWYWEAKEGVTFPIEVTFELKEAGGYMSEYLLHQLSRTNNREDYADLTDEQFANFRAVTTSGMGKGKLYRSSSPINPELGRNTYADKAAEAAGVKTFMNLANNEETAKGYEGYAESYYSKQNIVFLNLGVDFNEQSFKDGLATGFRYMIDHEGPYLVHCTEGKDRAGYVSALLECLMGATYDEVVADYMTTYINYYGVELGSEQYNAIASSNIIKSLQRAFGVEDLSKADLKAGAVSYLKGIGLTDDEISKLIANLSDTEDAVKTIEIFETTDIHGYLMDTSSGDEATFQYRMAYISNVIKAARANEENDEVILLDSGDIYQGTPVSNLTYGNALRAAMDKMGYDAVSLGNHEFDWDVTTYATDKDGTMPAYEIGAFKGDSDIPVLAYDLIDNATGTKASFVQEYTILDKAGVTVAVIGYIPDYSMDIMAAKINPFTILEDLDKLNAKVDEVIEKEAPDAVIILAHASPEYIAKAVDAEKVDLVLGGHSHQITYGVADNGVAYMQGNCQAQGYANTKLHVNTETGEVTVDEPTYVKITGDKTALYDTEENADKLDAEIVAISKASWDAVKDEMSEVLGYVDQSIYRRQKIGDSTNTIAGNWLTGIMLRATAEQNTVVAFTNSGGIRCDLLMDEGAEKRDITIGDIYTISPFGNRWYVYDITGAELAKTVENSFGNANYGDQFSGMTVKYIVDGEDSAPTEPGGWPTMAPRKVVSIVLDDGTVVDINDTTKTYRVVTNEYCATLPGSVFEDKTPVVDVNEAPVDNEAIISVLRAEGKANDGKLALDLSERCLEVKVNPFSDVSEDAWYYDYVMAAAEAGLVNGYEDGTFLPEGSLTRAEATTLLYRAAGSPAVEGKASFTDLDRDWYQDAIAWAEQNKVVNGVGKGKFEPEEYVTREQLVTMIWRLEGSKKVEKALEGFEDSSKVNDWAVDAFAWAIEEGIINGTTFSGKTGTYLAPQDNITRAEAAKVFVVYSEK